MSTKPTIAANKPADRSEGDGNGIIDAIILFIASGNSAYISPSITSTSAKAVKRSGNIKVSANAYYYLRVFLPSRFLK